MANPTATLSKPIATAVLAFTFAAFSVYMWKRKSRVLEAKVRELESSLVSESAKCAAERQGRIRAQQVIQKLQDLRTTLAKPNEDDADETTSYPMTPIGIVHSCFSTRNGTPRQPLVVPLARACLVFNTSRVPPAALEGIETYSHCWVIYVFHLNTNLQKLWKDPSKSKFKAKVRVPRLKGDKMGVFSTRSPHRPCPIGLTVAKVESVQGNTILLSGVDLVDGTPVLDIKPYLPYCDSIQGASVPSWVAGENLLAVASISFSDSFDSSLADCWEKSGKNSLYSSPNEFKSLIRQVLSWDIRSLSQRIRPHEHLSMEDDERPDNISDSEDHRKNEHSVSNGEILYHVILEGLKVSYRINGEGNVVVEKISLSSAIANGRGTNLITRHGETDQGELS